MSDKKQTAVSWLRDKLFQDFGVAFPDHIANEALQMESKKQQKYDEMLGMLEEILEAQEIGEVVRSYKIKQLIKEAKEL